MRFHLSPSIHFVCAALIGCGLFVSLVAHAAVITVLPGAINIDTQGQSVNAIELHLSFDPGAVSLQNLNTGGSIVNFWIQSPAISDQNGTLDLSGIIPGGVTTASGTIVSYLTVPIRPDVLTQFKVVSARVLLNDGKGTEAAVSVVTIPFSATAPAISSPATDLLPPDSFVPQIGHDPNLFDGDYFVVFSTTDPQSGIDHYEVLEGSDTVWHVATSPYRLHDQSLSSNIYVRAVNKEGNFRVVKVPATNPKKQQSAIPWIIIVEFGCGILLIWALWFFLWSRRRG